MNFCCVPVSSVQLSAGTIIVSNKDEDHLVFEEGNVFISGKHSLLSLYLAITLKSVFLWNMGYTGKLLMGSVTAYWSLTHSQTPYSKGSQVGEWTPNVQNLPSSREKFRIRYCIFVYVMNYLTKITSLLKTLENRSVFKNWLLERKTLRSRLSQMFFKGLGEWPWNAVVILEKQTLIYRQDFKCFNMIVCFLLLIFSYTTFACSSRY